MKPHMIAIVDASWQAGRAGCGVVLSYTDTGAQQIIRDYGYGAHTSNDAEFEGIRKALALLAGHDAAPGSIVMCDNSEAVLHMQREVRTNNSPYRVEYLWEEERDGRYALAHRLSVKARQATKEKGRLAEGLPMAARMPIRGRRPPAPEQFERRKVYVVVEDMGSYDRLAQVLIDLPEHLNEAVHHPVLTDGHAMFALRVDSADLTLLQASLPERSKIYVGGE